MLTSAPLVRRVMLWALLADSLPIYPLYALLFLHHGQGEGRISALFAIWSATSVVAAVPTGALADRFSRRGCLIAAGPLQAAAWLTWLCWPSFTGYAVGFALWGIAGSLVGGAFEAWLWDALAAAGSSEEFARVSGRVRAAGLVAQLVAAAGATLLFPVGGYGAVVAASAALSLLAAGVASGFPEAPRSPDDADRSEGSLRTALRELRCNALLRRALVGMALVTSLDAMEEYFGLAAYAWGVQTAEVPLATVAIPLAGVLGASLAGRAGRLSAAGLAGVLVAGGLLLLVAGLWGRASGLVLVAVFYAGYQLVDVAVGARLQARIEASARATVTSVADLGVEADVFVVYAAWAFGGLVATAAYVLVVAALVGALFKDPPRRGRLSSGMGATDDDGPCV